MTSTLGPATSQSNKLLFSSVLAPLSSFANATKHGLTLPPLSLHHLSTHFNPTFSNTSPHPLPGLYHPSPPPLTARPQRIPSARCVKVPLTKKSDICNTGWNMYYLLPSLTTIPAGMWKYPPCPLIPGSTATPPLPLFHP